MIEYLDLSKRVLLNGSLKRNERTGTKTISFFGENIVIDMSNGFPLLTSKKMAFKTMLIELEWFLHGRTDLRFLLERNCHIWSSDAFRKFGKDYAEFLGVPFDSFTIKEFEWGVLNDNDYFHDGCDLGPIYGSQWRGGYGIRTTLGDKTPDQIMGLVDGLKRDPFGRRHLVVAWNPLCIEEMTLPPCWVPGSLVNVSDGKMIPIEDIKIGDKIIADDGSSQEVSDVMINEYNGDIYNFKLFGSRRPLSVTPNHPFLIKGKGYVEAKDVVEDDYFAIPINKKDIIPEFNIIIKDNQYSSHEQKFLLEDNDYWYLMGYFLGDGWLQREKEEIYFVIANKDIDRILPKLNKFIGLARLKNSGQNCTKFVGRKQMDFYILSHFGEKAYGKCIPDFVHDAPIDKIKSFISGYCESDGCVTKNRVLYTTVSDHIAYGLQRLYAKIGIKASVCYQKRPEKTLICDREVNQRNTYSINIESGKNFSDKYTFDEDHLWLRVDSISIVNDYKCNVYNLSVNNRHTYCVNNIVNHNCHFAFQMNVREVNGLKYLDLKWSQRSGDLA